jgi:hypothetical protein
MTVQEYLEKRNANTYGKTIRVISLTRGAKGSDWTLYSDCEVLKISVTTKFIFIYVK